MAQYSTRTPPSIWHGTADKTVAEANARTIVHQWQGVHGVVGAVSSDTVNGQVYEVCEKAAGPEVIDLHLLKGWGQGTPIDSTIGYGQTAPYMLDAGIPSAVHIALNWGLTPSFLRREGNREARETRKAPSISAAIPKQAASWIQDVIENALRSAGLME